MGSVGMASSMTSISSIGIGSGAGNVGVSRAVTGSLTLGPPPTMAGGGLGGVGSQGHPSTGTSVLAAGADGGLVGDGAAHVPPHMRYTPPGSVTGPAGGTAGLAGLAGSGLGGALPSCTGGVGAGAGGGSAASRAAERSCPTAAYEGRVSSTVMAAPPTGHLAQGPVPPYEALINFPRAKSRSAIHCVMCGRQPNSTDMTGNAPGMIVIPRQNKDVCRECDKALWLHAESSMYFKWCKGCKRFRNLTAFAEKLAASKCDRCRERGRQGYMRRKGAGQDGADGAEHDHDGHDGDDDMPVGVGMGVGMVGGVGALHEA